MKRNYNVRCLLLQVLFTTVLSYTYAQDTTNKMSVGDHVPDVSINGFLYDTAKTVKLSELYKGNLLLMDFGSISCKPCLESIPKLNSLKKKFSGRLEVLSVFHDEREQVLRFFGKREILKNANLHFTTDDKVLTKLFPHTGLPHVVWIDSSGKLIATTASLDVTIENIYRFLDRQQLNVRIKKDVAFNRYAPFHMGDSSFLSRSILTGNIPGVLSSTMLQNTRNPDEHSKYDRVLFTNLPLNTLFKFAVFHGDISIRNNKRIIYEVKNPLKYLDPFDVPDIFKKSNYKSRWEWQDSNTYCYELKLPYPVAAPVLYNYMLQDINRYFNLHSRFEMRVVECWALESLGKNKKLLFRKNEEPTILFRKNGTIERLQHQKMDTLVYYLNRSIISGMVVNHTEIRYPVTVDFYGLSGGSVESINNFLSKYRLVLRKRKVSARMFVVSEKQ